MPMFRCLHNNIQSVIILLKHSWCYLFVTFLLKIVLPFFGMCIVAANKEPIRYDKDYSTKYDGVYFRYSKKRRYNGKPT